jgi:hypothetical protein
MQRLVVPALASLVFLSACGNSEKRTCDPAAQTGCAVGLTCELVENGAPACFAPVVLRGTVTDLTTLGAVAGARVVALDANRAPASAVAVSGQDGSYALTIPSRRRADGTPSSGAVTLRADARAYQTFPAGVRFAVPIDLATATNVDGTFTLETSLTEVGLIRLPDGAGTGSIQGTVATPADRSGVLIVAETGASGASAVADLDGDFAIFNLDPGEYTVKAYARGQNYAPAPVTLAAGQDAQVSLDISGPATATVSGSVQTVNPGQGSATSIILIVESTFDPVLVRGDAPPGLRAPDPGLDPDVTGAFSISGVPDGNYVALAAYENDFLVRDPDLCISGTQIAHVSVQSGALASTAPSFKVTGSLDVMAPGASGPEEVPTATPTFSWNDDSSEDSYDVAVYDSFGNVVWQVTIPGVSGSAPQLTYGQTAGVTTTVPALPLEPGMYYQFRATSSKQGCSLSQTEDLKGVFFLARP